MMSMRCTWAIVTAVGALGALGALAPGCSSSSADGGRASDGPLVVADGCQPLLAEPGEDGAAAACLAPFPSDPIAPPTQDPRPASASICAAPRSSNALEVPISIVMASS